MVGEPGRYLEDVVLGLEGEGLGTVGGGDDHVEGGERGQGLAVHGGLALGRRQVLLMAAVAIDHAVSIASLEGKNLAKNGKERKIIFF